MTNEEKVIYKLLKKSIESQITLIQNVILALRLPFNDHSRHQLEALWRDLESTQKSSAEKIAKA